MHASHDLAAMDGSEDREEASRRADEELVSDNAAENEKEESEAPPAESIKYFNNKPVSTAPHSRFEQTIVDSKTTPYITSLFRWLQRACPLRRQHMRKSGESIFSA